MSLNQYEDNKGNSHFLICLLVMESYILKLKCGFYFFTHYEVPRSDFEDWLLLVSSYHQVTSWLARLVADLWGNARPPQWQLSWAPATLWLRGSRRCTAIPRLYMALLLVITTLITRINVYQVNMFYWGSANLLLWFKRELNLRGNIKCLCSKPYTVFEKLESFVEIDFHF